VAANRRARGRAWLLLACVPLAVFVLVFTGMVTYFRLTDDGGEVSAEAGPQARGRPKPASPQAPAASS
jgi:hypothetical protein